MNILCVLYETFRNFINTIMRPDYQDYIGKVWNQPKGIRRNYKIFNASIYFVEIAEINYPLLLLI